MDFYEGWRSSGKAPFDRGTGSGQVRRQARSQNHRQGRSKRGFLQTFARSTPDAIMLAASQNNEAHTRPTLAQKLRRASGRSAGQLIPGTLSSMRRIVACVPSPTPSSCARILWDRLDLPSTSSSEFEWSMTPNTSRSPKWSTPAPSWAFLEKTYFRLCRPMNIKLWWMPSNWSRFKLLNLNLII